MVSIWRYSEADRNAYEMDHKQIFQTVERWWDTDRHSKL